MFHMAQDTLRGAGHTVQVSDLYSMRFDPVSDRRNFASVKNAEFFKQQIEELHATEVGGFAPDVEAELRKMEWCDLMIWQFPLWWFGLPGILKGWADRVFAMGRTYGGERFYENGVFKGKRALLSVTTGGPEAVYQKGGWNGDSEEEPSHGSTGGRTTSAEQGISLSSRSTVEPSSTYFRFVLPLVPRMTRSASIRRQYSAMPCPWVLASQTA